MNEREALLAGAATAVQPLLFGQLLGAWAAAEDTSFAVLHGLYWLAANLAVLRPLLLTVDDTHWADEPSVRWLAYLARRLEGLPLAMLVTLRSGEAIQPGGSLLALRAEAQAILRPGLLSESAVSAVVRAIIGDTASDELCLEAWKATGGNPLYLTELLRSIGLGDRHLAGPEPAELLAAGLAEIAPLVIGRVGGLDPRALGLAKALAVLEVTVVSYAWRQRLPGWR